MKRGPSNLKVGDRVRYVGLNGGWQGIKFRVDDASELGFLYLVVLNVPSWCDALMVGERVRLSSHKVEKADGLLDI